MKKIKEIILGFAAVSLGAAAIGTFAISRNSAVKVAAADSTASITSFSTLSGNIDTNITYTSYKGNAATAPAITNGTTYIRLYQTGTSGKVGGYITASTASGFKISAFSTTTTMATSLDYSADGGTTWSGTTTPVAANGVYSKSGLSTSSVSIGCFGTTTTARYYCSSLVITYAATTDPSISINSVPLAVNVGDSGTLTATTANASGASINWSSDNGCVTIDSSTGAYVAYSIGTATITASIVVNSTTYSSTGKVNVSGSATIAQVLAISTSEGTGVTTTYKVTVGGTITATATSSVTISDGTNALLVYWTYSPNDSTSKGWIINGTISFTGYVQNYNGTAELNTPVVVSYTDSAIAFATSSNSSLDSECAASDVTEATWSALSTNFSTLDTHAQSRLTGATSTDTNSPAIAEFITRYKIIVNKYGYANFMNIAVGANPNLNSDTKSDSGSMIVITILGALALISVGGWFVLKKKRQT